MARQAQTKLTEPLRLYLLGPFRLERANESMRLPTRKAESLLAYLTLTPPETRHAREKLAALLWGDSPDDLARSSLRRALVLLRQVIGNDLLLTDREIVQLNPAYPLWVDAREFQTQAERSLKDSHADPASLDISLYRDDLLIDFYDEWITPLREHFRSLFIEALLKRTHHARAQKDWAHAIQFARIVLQKDAANEIAHQQLMNGYWRTGKRNAALNQFKECERILKQELGVEPSAETIALYNQIKERVETEPRLSNLPIPLTTFVGRAHELAEIKRLLTTTRLLTLTGTGGSGKTRLALQAATELQNDFRDGVGWVDLAKLTEPSLLPQTVAQALGIYETSDRSLIETLANVFRHRHFLLVLDNCEHLVDACAALIELLLRTCPQLKIIATSRQVLDLNGETAWIVPSLAMPAETNQNEAVELFVQRARAVMPGFALTNETARVVDTICRRLDGIPLAIELAASRVKVLSVEEIAAHLGERFQLLISGNRTGLPRHRTLRATMDWSYELLSAAEKILLRRLAIFTGGATLHAATKVCGREPLNARDILALLSNLIDKSLVIVRERHGASRYHLLETIREYALERLRESGEADSFQQHHLDFIIELAQVAQAKLVASEPMLALQQLEAEQDNLRAALHRAIEQPAWHAQSVQLASLVWRFWYYRGESSEGRNWLERSLAAYPSPQDESERKDHLTAQTALSCLMWLMGETSAARARLEQNIRQAREWRATEPWAYALAWLSMIVNDLGEYDLARTYADESIHLFEQVDAPWGLAYAFFVRGKAALSLGNFDEAQLFYQASVERFHNLGNHWGLALPLGHLGFIAYAHGDYTNARRYLSERLSLAREFRAQQLICFALYFLACIYLRTDEQNRAEQFLIECLQIATNIGSPNFVFESLFRLGELATVREQYRRAVQLFAAAERQRLNLAIRLDGADQREYEAARASLQSKMSAPAFAEAWADGQAMPLEQIMQSTLSDAIGFQPMAIEHETRRAG